MANRRFIDFPIASTVGDSDIILIWQSGANKQTTKATFLSGLPENLDELNDVAISGLTNGQILRYDSVTGKWENTDQGNLDLNDLNDVSIVSPSNGQVLVYNSSTSKWENSSGGYVPYTGAVTTVNLGAQTIQAGQFVKAGGTAAQFLKADGSVDSNVYGTGTVTSVALTMPSAFSVANSPITTAGTLAVTGAGTVGQYIRGDGSLADFPQASGGGSSVSYYLNGSISQGTIGGVAYKELNKVPILGAGTDFTINADGYIASFLTDAGDPNLLEITGGNWNFETYFSASSSGGSPSFYVELYKYDGTTFTLIASSSSSPELIAFGTNLNPYFSTLAVPTTTLALTDRLAIRYYVTHSGRTITLHTENNHLCQVVTTFTTGLTSLNGLTAQVQNLAVGTSGTDFNIASATATHTFNLPTASATNRGALSSADWTTFNNKQNALGYVPVPETRTITINGVSQDLSANRTYNVGTVTSVGLSSATSGVTIGGSPVTGVGAFTLAIATASGSQNGLLSSTDWTTFNNKQNALTNPVTGTGTSGQVAYFTGTSAISSESNLFWDATNDRLGIGTSTPARQLEVSKSGAAFIRAADTLNNVNVDLIAASNGGFVGTATNHNFFIQSNNSEKIAVFTDGNVLIQTGGTFTNNGARLQVSGNANFTGSIQAATDSNIVGTSVNARIIVTASGVANTVVGFNNSGSTTTGVTNNTAYLGVLQSYPLVFTTNSVERLRIEATGAANFSNSLRIQGSTVPISGSGTELSYDGTNGYLLAYNRTSSAYLPLFVQGSNLSFGTGDGTTRLTIASTGASTFSSANQSQNAVFNSTGNVLITSNASPAVNNGGSLSFGGRYWTESNTIATFGRIHGKKENSIDGGTAGYLSFETTLDATAFLSEKMRITSTGPVLIGTTTNPYGVGSLIINHTSSFSRTYFQRGVNLIEIAPSDGSSANIISSSYTISGSAYRPLAFSARQNPADLNLTTGGNVLIGTETSGSSKLRIVGLPTSSAGLSSGDVWNNGGDLRIV